MSARPHPVLDMTLDGRFQEPPHPKFLTRIAVTALCIGVAAAGLAAAALAFWLALALVPVALIAILVAYAAFRLQLWRIRKQAFSRAVHRP